MATKFYEVVGRDRFTEKKQIKVLSAENAEDAKIESGFIHIFKVIKRDTEFQFNYIDNQGNELKSETRDFRTKKEAKEHAKKLFAVACINNLKKIEVK
jgi:hypothetical protein